jgi:hypothetical protein
MRISFRGSSDEHVIEIASADSGVALAFSGLAPGWPHCGLFGVIGASYQQEQTYTRAELIQDAVELEETLERERDVLPYHFSY